MVKNKIIEYTVFLASPSIDTVEEREVVCAAITAINSEPEYIDKAQLVLVRWDDPIQKITLSAGRSAQIDVIEQAGNPAECDLVIAIYRHSMGGKLGAR